MGNDQQGLQLRLLSPYLLSLKEKEERNVLKLQFIFLVFFYLVKLSNRVSNENKFNNIYLKATYFYN